VVCANGGARSAGGVRQRGGRSIQAVSLLARTHRKPPL
jgi:hypothetical protein